MNTKSGSWSNGIKRFPNSLANLHEFIREIKAVDLESVDFEKLKGKIADLTDGYVKQEYGWRLNNLCRARKNEGKPSFTKFSEILSPPKTSVKVFGRLNRPGESIFYASEKRDDTLHEVKAIPGDIVTIVQLRPISEDIELDHLDFAVFETACAKTLGFKNLMNPLLKIKNKIHPEDYPKQKLISEFIVNEVTKSVNAESEWEYKTTCAIAEVLWKDSLMFDMLAYPSVTKKLHGLNLAFPNHIIKQYYQVEIVNEIQIQEISHSHVRFETMKKMALRPFEWKELEASAMEQDGDTEIFEVPKSTCVRLDKLNLGVEPLRCRV